MINKTQAIGKISSEKTFLEDKFFVKEIGIFGSVVRGEQHSDSDIDIAVIVDSYKGDIVDIFSLLLKLRRNIDIRIEPHPFELKDFNDSNPFAGEIIRTGRKIS